MPNGKEEIGMAKYPLIVLLCFLGAMMLFQPELLCKLISFFVVKNSEPSDYRLSFVRLRGLFCLIAACPFSVRWAIFHHSPSKMWKTTLLSFLYRKKVVLLLQKTCNPPTVCCILKTNRPTAQKGGEKDATDSNRTLTAAPYVRQMV